MFKKMPTVHYAKTTSCPYEGAEKDRRIEEQRMGAERSDKTGPHAHASPWRHRSIGMTRSVHSWKGLHRTGDLPREIGLTRVWGFSEGTHMRVLGRDRFLVNAARMPGSFAYGVAYRDIWA
jgi:hypothetical protein